MRVVVGLGNPGARYADTRHNIGFRVADQLVAAGGGRWSEGPQAATASTRVAGEPALLVKPLTYMNRSGDAVASLRERCDFAVDELLVVLDDFHLDFGRVRLRRGGSDGGHNGLASVLQRLATDQVPRLRLGIGPVPPGDDEIGFVLTPFARGENVGGLIERGCAATRCWIEVGVEAAMNRVNGCPPL